jgi:hypothetical protein
MIEMLKIEKALELYTDKLNAGKQIDFAWLKAQMSAEGYKEFLDLMPFVILEKSAKEADNFDKLFKLVDETSVEYSDDNGLPQAAGFRNASNKQDVEAVAKLDEIFREEFSDDA